MRYKNIAILALAIVLPLILNNDFQRELLVMTFIFALATLSLDIIYGGMGQYSFGHAAFFGAGAYTSALLSLKLGVSVWVGFLASVAVCAGMGFLLGFVSLKRTRGLALAMVTLGFGMIATTLMLRWREVSGGNQGLMQIPPPVIGGFKISSEFSFYYLELIILIAAVYFLHRLWRSRFGRSVIAIRENENLARSIGIPAFRNYVIAFTISTGLVGLAGATYAHHFGFVNPDLLGLNYMFMMLIMVIVGGKGTLGGPIVGAFIFVWAQKYLPVSATLRLVIFGVILFMFVTFAPRGVFPYLQRLDSALRTFILQRAWVPRFVVTSRRWKQWQQYLK